MVTNADVIKKIMDKKNELLGGLQSAISKKDYQKIKDITEAMTLWVSENRKLAKESRRTSTLNDDLNELNKIRENVPVQAWKEAEKMMNDSGVPKYLPKKK